jgi:hypothetical protein
MTGYPLVKFKQSRCLIPRMKCCIWGTLARAETASESLKRERAMTFENLRGDGNADERE